MSKDEMLCHERDRRLAMLRAGRGALLRLTGEAPGEGLGEDRPDEVDDETRPVPTKAGGESRGSSSVGESYAA